MGLVNDAGCLNSIQFGHPNVQNYGIRGNAIRHLDQLPASGRCPNNMEFWLQQPAKAFGHQGMVVRDDNAWLIHIA